jgi:dipeptidyl aminopeptidase/acylaminoacyl peptidase
MTNRTQRITVEDLYQLNWLEDVQVSPDGRRTAAVQVTVDRVQNRYRRSIVIGDAEQGMFRRFTTGARGDTQPRWSPDGRRLAFVSQRDDERGQIYVIAVDGGEAQQVTAALNGAADPAWSADGRQLAFRSATTAAERAEELQPAAAPQNAWQAQQRRDERKQAEAERLDPRVIRKLPYRSGTSYHDDRNRHLYVIDVPQDGFTAAGPGRRLTDGAQDYSAAVWLPDGSGLLAVTTRDAEADSIFMLNSLVRINLSNGQVTQLTAAGESAAGPQIAPNGRWAAFTVLNEARPLAEGRRLALLDLQDGSWRSLSDGLDRGIEAYAWRPDSTAIVCSAGWHGQSPLLEIGLDGSMRTLHETPGVIEDLACAADGAVLVIAGNERNPSDLYRISDGQQQVLTAVNGGLLAERTITPFEEVWYQAPDGKAVQGWIVYPPAFDAAQQYPLAVHIHGGPHAMWAPGVRSMWHEWQATAAAGYVVFFCNPRGSDGYGAAWRDGAHANWGAGDEGDIHAGIDLVISRGFIDAQRIAVTGGSYGGFMTTWLIGHSSRFRCAVAARGVYNLLTQHNTSDAHELIEIEFDGWPWNTAEQLWRHSPLAYAAQIDTPLLLLHSEQDYRVAISEAEQLFSFLRRQKKTVELVRYPREGHELTRSGEPRHRADHMQRTIDWFNRFC